MRFGPVAIRNAEGAILAHSTAAGDRRLRKGHRIGPDEIAGLMQAGVTEIVAAVLEPGDLTEDEAATRVASSMIVSGIDVKAAATGRVNLHAREAGVFVVDKQLVDAVNAVDPAVTLATVPHYAAVEKGQMVATVKIIPFAVPGAVVEKVISLCAAREAFSVKPFRPRKLGIVQTMLPGVKDSVLDKTVRVTEGRLARSGSHVVGERRTRHDESAVADAIAALADESDVIVIFGASAMSDPDDVVPAAIREAGGEVLRAGMPVDPGNLIVLGSLDGKPVLGAPGCARSPKENGFDWVLDRLIADIPVSADDVAGMGVGGLLMEIATRPQPRELPKRRAAPKVYAVILAAGRSSRMGGPNKLLARFGDEPLVRLTAGRAIGSRTSGTVVVTGHQEERVRAALEGLPVVIVSNPDFASGLASSLKAGIAALPDDAAGALILLGDMPGVGSADIDRLVAAFTAAGGTSVVRATHEGKRGNPVLLPRALFPAVATLEGDTGARHLVEADGLSVVDVEIGEGASIDVDTPDAMHLAGGVLQE
ncbi:MAG TPA: molybdopterin-binding/glycosyltransferase family 2 protein [Rhizobiaceae bacterium]|nr:molybdopterin-binding/glycosyltransferase family 2 protein [Rhizobiaceae bacterium]